MQGETKHGCSLFEHNKKPVVAIEQVKKMWGYDSQIQSNTEMYGSKIICRIPSLNPDYLIEEKHRLEHEKRIKDCIAVNQSLQDEIELASLLAGSAKGEELKRVKANIFKQFSEQNQIMGGQCTQKQLGWKNTTLETQQNILIEELKDLLVVGQNYQNLLSRVNKIAYRQEVNKDKEELELKKEEIIKEIIDKVEDIISSGSDGNDILKKITIQRLENMLFFLDEISNSDDKYKRFLAQCKATQEVSFNDSQLESNSKNYDNNIDGFQESPWLILNKWGVKISCSRHNNKIKESKSISETGQNTRINDEVDIFANHNDDQDDDPIVFSNISNKPKNQTFQESEFLTADEVIAKVEHDYKKSQRRRLTATDIGKMQLLKTKLSEPSYESIVVALQTITGYQTILSSVYKILNLNDDWIKQDSRIQKQLQQLQHSIHQMNILIAGGNNSISLSNSDNSKKSKLNCNLISRGNSIQLNSNPTLERIILANTQHMFTCQTVQLSILQFIKQIQSIKDSFYIPPKKDKYNQSNGNEDNEQTAITSEHLLIHGNDLKPLLARIDPSVFIKQEIPHIRQVVATPQVGMRNKPSKYHMRNSLKKSVKRGNLENINEYHHHPQSAGRKYNNQNRSSSQNTRGVLATESDKSDGISCIDKKSIRTDSRKENQRNQMIRENSQKTDMSNKENRSSVNRIKSQRKYSDISSCSSVQNKDDQWSRNINSRIRQDTIINISSYINNCFDESGRNEDICNQTRDIDIESAVNSIALRNIFAEEWQKIDLSDAIEELKGKKGSEEFQKQDYINAIREKRKESINESNGNSSGIDNKKERSQKEEILKNNKMKIRSKSIVQQQTKNILSKDNSSLEAVNILPATPKSFNNSRTRRVNSFGSCFSGSNNLTLKQDKNIQDSQKKNRLQIQEIQVNDKDSGEKQPKSTDTTTSVIAVNGLSFKQRKLNLYNPQQGISHQLPQLASFDSLKDYADPQSTISQKNSDLKVSFDRKSMKTTQESNFMSKINGPASSKGNSAAFSFYAGNTNIIKNNKISCQDKTLQTININTENDQQYDNQDYAEFTMAKTLEDENRQVLKNIQLTMELHEEGDQQKYQDNNINQNNESYRNDNQDCDISIIDDPNISAQKQEKQQLLVEQQSSEKSKQITLKSSKLPLSDHVTHRSHQTEEESEEITLEQKRIEQEKQQEQKEEAKLNLRNQIVQKYLALKRPRYIMLGTSGVAVKGTVEEINKIQLNTDIAQRLSRQAENKKNRARLVKHINEMGKQGEISNIEVLSGPPKKYQFEVSSIQHDFNDKLISKMIKH